MSEIIIRESTKSDLSDILEVERLAFDSNEEAELVKDLLNDMSAEPILSMVAYLKEEPVGHILFTRSTILENEHEVLTHILAPLAVKPDFQSRGIGGSLINHGINCLKDWGSKIVFVLGYPEYYSKFGFIPDAESLGYEPPYPILEKNSDAWMLKPMEEGVLNKYKGKVICADEMNKPEYWRE